METVCHNQLIFENLFSKEVVADFAGGRITSDAGGLLLRELNQRGRIAENAARGLHFLPYLTKNLPVPIIRSMLVVGRSPPAEPQFQRLFERRGAITTLLKEPLRGQAESRFKTG